MRGKKAALLAGVICFAAVLVLPLLTMNRIPGVVSETENRYLATFPDVFDGEGYLSDGLKSGFENWLSDNLGFRSVFVKLAAGIRLKLFPQSISDRVEVGRDGWYYFTGDHNVEIGAGKYKLSEELLQDIAQRQQRISDWYARQGIPYLLVMDPGKPSIYPEYIASGDYAVQETVCDQLERYLEENTTVQVVNAKTAMLANKDKGKLYYQHDTHATDLGSYVIYQTVAEKLEQLGIAMDDLSVTFLDEQKENGDLSDMMGYSHSLGNETIPTAQWPVSSTMITDGPLYDEGQVFQQADEIARSLGFAIFDNPEAKNGTLLIYGDSQWRQTHKIPQMLAESFRTVMFMGLRAVDMEFDELVKPDVVIFGVGERQIDFILKREPFIVDTDEELPELPQTTMITKEEYGAGIGRQGISLDRFNGVTVRNSPEVALDSSTRYVELHGWAADFKNNAPFQALYLQVGDAVVRLNYGQRRADVGEAYENEALNDVGFDEKLPASMFEGASEISFIGVDANGEYLYEPVTYKLIVD